MIIFYVFLFCILLSMVLKAEDFGGIPRNYACEKCRPQFHYVDELSAPRCTSCGQFMTECTID